jgi:hypothetical protein
MTDMKQVRFELSAPPNPKRRFSKICVPTVCCALAVLGIMLCWSGIATAQEDPSSLQRGKAELEVQKLELEVAQLRKERGSWPNWVIGVLGVLVGFVGTAAPVWGARRARLGALDQSVHDKRLDLYPNLVNASAPLALYFPRNESHPASIRPRDCGVMGRVMSAWYFQGGGLLLSVESRDAYFKLARALTCASLANKDLRVPTFPADAEDVSKEKFDDYRKKLRAKKINLDDVENWSFGVRGAKPKNPATRFRDYVFLQWLSSQLRTKLTEDLRSRRRPASDRAKRWWSSMGAFRA